MPRPDTFLDAMDGKPAFAPWWATRVTTRPWWSRLMGGNHPDAANHSVGEVPARRTEPGLRLTAEHVRKRLTDDVCRSWTATIAGAVGWALLSRTRQ